MTVLIRNFYTNTGLKGTEIDPTKQKLAVAFTAVRNEDGDQVVQFGVSSCHANDQFKRKEGFAIAKARLDLVINGATEIPKGLAPFIGTVIFSDTNLDEIPDLIVATFEHKLFEAKKAVWKVRDKARKDYIAETNALEALREKFYESPEFTAAIKRVEEAENAYFVAHA